VIDGFAIISFSTYEDLEVCSQCEISWERRINFLFVFTF
jgi:hypothetical protein